MDIDITISNGHITTNLYDKRNDFKFDINSFPFLSSNIHNKRTHGVLISQLIRFSRVCSSGTDFINTSHRLIHKLIQQRFIPRLLRRKASIFYDKYYHLIKKYDYTKRFMISNMFERDT